MAQESAVSAGESLALTQLLAPSQRRRFLLLVMAALFGLYLGFLRFDSVKSQWLVRNFGYSWMLVLSGAWLAAVIAVFRAESRSLRTLWPGSRHALLILACFYWIMRMDPVGYKVLFDEPVQVSTALTMHQDRELAATVRAYSLNDIFTVLTSHLDKRPPFFPFLIATVHDLTGYRLNNAFFVNGVGTIALLLVVWHIGRLIGSCPAAGGVFVVLLATLPALGVTATSAGMDHINLSLIALLLLTAMLYSRNGTNHRLWLMVITALLLAYTRYESVLYIATIGLIWIGISWRDRRWEISWVWLLLPVALVLYGWHNTVLSNNPALWELRENQTDRFSLSYAANNLLHARIFLFSLGRELPNSVLLTVAGLLGAVIVAVQNLRRRSAIPMGLHIAIGAVAAGVLVNFALLICYYWGELDDPIVTRLALPLHLLFAVLAVAGWAEWNALKPRWASWRIPLGAGALAIVIWTAPTIAKHYYTERDLMRDNFEWERRIVAEYWPAPGLIITNRAPVCWLAERVPALSFEHARARQDRLKWHFDRHSFGRVFVMQRVLTGGGNGEWGVDLTQQVPETWRLREVAVRRVGLTLTRISELIAIDPLETPVANRLADNIRDLRSISAPGVASFTTQEGDFPLAEANDSHLRF
jgi:hypothetical protein